MGRRQNRTQRKAFPETVVGQVAKRSSVTLWQICQRRMRQEVAAPQLCPSCRFIYTAARCGASGEADAAVGVAAAAHVGRLNSDRLGFGSAM
jgi:hypothetical protein